MHGDPALMTPQTLTCDQYLSSASIQRETLAQCPRPSTGRPWTHARCNMAERVIGSIRWLTCAI